MRILIHMGDTYPNEGPNAKRMRTFYEAFKEKGHEVYVLAPTYENEPIQNVLEVCPKGAIIVVESTVSLGIIDKFVRRLLKTTDLKLEVI